jgi:adenosylcobinamide amidohydrolase
MKTMFVAASLLVISSAAFAQDGTVNAYTSADEAKAKAAVTAAGYTPGVIATAQNGNLFVRAMKDGQPYMITVTPDGHAYGGPPISGVGMAKP